MKHIKPYQIIKESYGSEYLYGDDYNLTYVDEGDDDFQIIFSTDIDGEPFTCEGHTTRDETYIAFHVDSIGAQWWGGHNITDKSIETLERYIKFDRTTLMLMKSLKGEAEEDGDMVYYVVEFEDLPTSFRRKHNL